MLKLREKLNKYRRRVEPAEQPFQKVHDMVVNAQRRKMTEGDFNFDDSVLQTKGILQATALSFRLDIALFRIFWPYINRPERAKQKFQSIWRDFETSVLHLLTTLSANPDPRSRWKDISSWPSSMR